MPGVIGVRSVPVRRSLLAQPLFVGGVVPSLAPAGIGVVRRLSGDVGRGRRLRGPPSEGPPALPFRALLAGRRRVLGLVPRRLGVLGRVASRGARFELKGLRRGRSGTRRLRPGLLGPDPSSPAVLSGRARAGQRPSLLPDHRDDAGHLAGRVTVEVRAPHPQVSPAPPLELLRPQAVTFPRTTPRRIPWSVSVDGDEPPVGVTRHRDGEVDPVRTGPHRSPTRRPSRRKRSPALSSAVRRGRWPSASDSWEGAVPPDDAASSSSRSKTPPSRRRLSSSSSGASEETTVSRRRAAVSAVSAVGERPARTTRGTGGEPARERSFRSPR